MRSAPLGVISKIIKVLILVPTKKGSKLNVAKNMCGLHLSIISLSAELQETGRI